VALIQMGGSPETLAGLAAGAIDGGLLASPLHLQAAKFGYHLLADLSTIGIDYQGAGVVTTRSYMREAPDVTRRYVRAYVEGLHRFKTDKNFAVRVNRQVLAQHGPRSAGRNLPALRRQDYAQSSLSDDQRNSNGARRNRFAHAEGQEPRA
jgi:ABC-type nitrate/sulfonate/bicarbonate transport system substrate-binding protein